MYFIVSQLCDVGGGDLEHQPQPMLPPVIPNGNPSLDLELHWQDLVAIMEPEVTGRMKIDKMTFGKKVKKGMIR